MGVSWVTEGSVPRFQDQYLIIMVQLARMARVSNMSREEILDVTIKEKAKQITGPTWKRIQYTSMCSGGQVKKIYYPQVFDKIDNRIFEGDSRTYDYNDPQENEVTDLDIETGFMMFSTLVYCSELVALSQFLHNLFSTQSPRTIIHATVNTIQSDYIEKRMTRKLLNGVYLALDEIFQFQLGRILLATASQSQLEGMIARDRPYFIRYSQETDQCLKNISCTGIQDLVTTLGTVFIMCSCIFVSSDSTKLPHEVSLHAPHLIDSSGSLTPAALIPFCAYQTIVSNLGKTRRDLPFPVCNAFQPTPIEGQLCYFLNLSRIRTEKKFQVQTLNCYSS